MSINQNHNEIVPIDEPDRPIEAIRYAIIRSYQYEGMNVDEICNRLHVSESYVQEVLASESEICYNFTKNNPNVVKGDILIKLQNLYARMDGLLKKSIEQGIVERQLSKKGNEEGRHDAQKRTKNQSDPVRVSREMRDIMSMYLSIATEGNQRGYPIPENAIRQVHGDLTPDLIRENIAVMNRYLAN